MDDQLIRRFYNDDHTRESVKEYLLSSLNELALRKIYNRDSVDGIADAQEAIEDMFIELGEKYATKEAKEDTNQAR